MTQQGATPPDFWERVDQAAQRAVDRYMRSGATRNSSITGGRFTIKGGALVVESADGTEAAYFGAVTPALADGTYQPGLIIRREDGTIAMAMYDPIPSAEDYNQFLAIYDRSGNIIVSDDTDSGQGMARPYVPFVFYESRSSDWPTTTSSTFSTIYRAKGPKQQPRLYIEAWLNATGSGAVAEMRVLVNGVAWAATQQNVPGFVTGLTFGPLPVDGGHMSTLSIEIQARLVSGGGEVRVGVERLEGRQS